MAPPGLPQRTEETAQSQSEGGCGEPSHVEGWEAGLPDALHRDRKCDDADGPVLGTRVWNQNHTWLWGSEPCAGPTLQAGALSSRLTYITWTGMRWVLRDRPAAAATCTALSSLSLTPPWAAQQCCGMGPLPRDWYPSLRSMSLVSLFPGRQVSVAAPLRGHSVRWGIAAEPSHCKSRRGQQSDVF